MQSLPYGVALAVILCPTLLLAQHDHGDSSSTSPYANTQSTEIRSLTQAEIDQLRRGEGMGLARPAELNHFPGPKHVLELGDQLGLTSAQRSEIQAIRDSMSTRAVTKGEEILSLVQRLDALFQSGTPTNRHVEEITTHLGHLQGELQAIHLLAHIATRSKLTAEQTRRYDELRGYSPPKGTNGSEP